VSELVQSGSAMAAALISQLFRSPRRCAARACRFVGFGAGELKQIKAGPSPIGLAGDFS